MRGLPGRGNGIRWGRPETPPRGRSDAHEGATARKVQDLRLCSAPVLREKRRAARKNTHFNYKPGNAETPFPPKRNVLNKLPAHYREAAPPPLRLTPQFSGNRFFLLRGKRKPLSL